MIGICHKFVLPIEVRSGHTFSEQGTWDPRGLRIADQHSFAAGVGYESFAGATLRMSAPFCGF